MKWIEYTDENYNLIKPGTIVKLENGAVQIVGDLNDAQGYCGCCTGPKIISFTHDFIPQIKKIKKECKKNANK